MASYIFYLILLSSICLAHSSDNGGFTVDMYHRDSPRSPFYDPSATSFQRLRGSISRAVSRKSSFVTSSLSLLTTGTVGTPIIPAGGEYLMKIKLGTPPVMQLGIADTGSDLTWTQCKPCTQCYKQNLPLFDPSSTSSYRPLSCESDMCAANGMGSCDSNNKCQYEVGYGDKSYSFGELAAETLTFGGNVSFPKVAFGCGHENGGTFSQKGTGIVGLGGGSVSIISQLKRSIGGRFSYCLTLLNANASSRISFGRNAVVRGPNVVSTPLVNKSPSTFYYLTLEGVSVGTERLSYYEYTTSSGIQTSSSGRKGNIIIDSGTTLTFVPEQFYEGVESALSSAITGTRVSDPQGSFGLCYIVGSDGSGGFSAPPVTAHFEGADVVLPKESLFVQVEEGIACLTLVPSKDLAIFGNLHQMNYHVGYDLVNGEVSFQPTDCSKPQ